MADEGPTGGETPQVPPQEGGEKVATSGNQTPAADQPPPQQAESTPAADQPPPQAEGEKVATSGNQTPAADQPPPQQAESTPAADQPPPQEAEKKPSGSSLLGGAQSPRGGAQSPLGGAQSPQLDAMQMLSKVRQVDGIQYSVPVTSDHFLIPANMTADTEVYIFGLLAPQAERLEVKFREAKTEEHVSLLIVIELQPAQYIALRTYQNKAAEDVAKEDTQITAGTPLSMRVKAYGDGSAKVTVNGQNLTFPPRDGFPLDKVLYFSIHGDFFTGSVSILKTQWPDHLHVTIGHQLTSGYHFSVEGSVAPDADKMIMNILRSHDVHDDVLLGIVAEFADTKQLVRRTKQEGVWLEEQVESEVPFEPGQPFKVDIAVGELNFQTCVNGHLLPAYLHKVFYGIGHNLCLEKNAKFKSLRVCSISHPKQWTNKPPNFEKATLLFYNATSPVISPIQLEPGNSFYVQGTPPPPCTEFKIALSKGAEETADALLVVHVQLQKGLVFVYDGTDGNKGDGQPLKVRANRLFSCRVDALADGFKVWVNILTATDSNADPFDVKQRFALNEAVFLNTFGEINNVTGVKSTEDVLE
ncbi:uncharacterized protein [Dermacentor albipictus]|uniref:uncharacterized protein n=1 Tax=Dermacentor albipictus TaxID=60249 RepID=UPI0031FC66BE